MRAHMQNEVWSVLMRFSDRHRVHQYEKGLWVIGGKDITSVIEKSKREGRRLAKKEGRGYRAEITKIKSIGTIDVF
jgi:hypothetical protein